MDIEIKFNNHSMSSEPCGICGQENGRRANGFAGDIGPAPFVKDTRRIACRECCARYAPELLAEIDVRRAEPEAVREREGAAKAAAMMQSTYNKVMLEAALAGEPYEDL